jgi:hypothetical protein
MSAFDELTLGELDDLRDMCLGGRNINDPTVDPLTLAGAVMWASNRKDDPGLSWDAFRHKTKMGDIKAFSLQMQAEEEAESLNPQ